jgi:TolA-binding protein
MRPSSFLPIVCAAELALGAAARAAEAPWHVPRADVRFEVDVASAPSEPRAGVLVTLPDGGVLPRQADISVTDSAGKPLKHEVVWRNPREGLAVVFEAREAGSRVHVYVSSGAPARRLPGAASGLAPSLLLYTRNQPDASLEAAHKLPADDPPGAEARFGTVPMIGQMENPWGPDDRYVSYYSGWIKLDRAGRVYLATVSDEGSECRVDGKVVASWPGLHNRNEGRQGQYGSWLDLSAGLHHMEYFHFEVEGAQEANVCWRPPGTAGDKLPVTIPESAYVRSGSGRVATAAHRDGRPLAAIGAWPRNYLWVRDRPVTLVALTAQYTTLHPADTRYTWSLPGGWQAEGRELLWPLEGDFPQEVTLTAAAGKASSKATVPVLLGTTPARASLNSPNDRKTYRDALLARCRAVPEGKRPCQGWSPDLWATLLAVIEPFKAKALLLEVFDRSRPDVLALPDADRWALEDAFFEVVRYTEPTNSLPWLTRLEQEEKTAARRFEWKLQRVDFTLYDLGDTNAARVLAGQVRNAATRPEDMIRALVRAGDVERLAGHYDDARRLYSSAQDRWMELEKSEAWRSSTAPVTAPVAPRKDRKPGAAPAAPQPPMRRPLDDNWKKAAVREATFYSTFRDQLRNGFLAEARATLRDWELELPMTKLTGDYPLAEAEYFVAAGLHERALKIVRAYRQGLDLSSYLPKAMMLELDCLQNLNRTEELKSLAREMIRKFPSHPAAEKAKRALE